MPTRVPSGVVTIGTAGGWDRSSQTEPPGVWVEAGTYGGWFSITFGWTPAESRTLVVDA